jgi:hypothetical protein
MCAFDEGRPEDQDHWLPLKADTIVRWNALRGQELQTGDTAKP